MKWLLSSSSDRRALDVVDGRGPLEGLGPHYSRRTPGSKTFTGVGQEIVLVTDCGRAVWAVVYQRTPSARGSGSSRGRKGKTDARPRYLWRNMIFRNEGAGLSSDLIREATARTYEEWAKRYGSLPEERLRTEVNVSKIRSVNPGYCYLMAGWERGPLVRGKRFLYAPKEAIVTLEEKVVVSLSDELRRPEYRGHENPLRGHCYVASEAFYHLSGGKDAGLKPMNVKHEGCQHWYLSGPAGIVDLTAGQFATPVPYDQGRGRGFLTTEPSKRARVLMARVSAVTA